MAKRNISIVYCCVADYLDTEIWYFRQLITNTSIKKGGMENPS